MVFAKTIVTIIAQVNVVVLVPGIVQEKYPPLNTNNQVSMLVQIVLAVAKIVAVPAAKRHVQIIVKAHAKMHVGAIAQENVQRDVKELVQTVVRMIVVWAARKLVGRVVRKCVFQHAKMDVLIFVH